MGIELKNGDRLLSTEAFRQEIITRRERNGHTDYSRNGWNEFLTASHFSFHRQGGDGWVKEPVDGWSVHMPDETIEEMRRAWIDANPNPEPVTYRYGMMNRPAHYAAPDGWIDAGKHPDFPNYGTVSYSRLLTPDELYRYEMRLIYPLPAMPVYPVGSTVRDVKTGKIHEVEHDGIEHWVGGDPMPIGGDWRDVAKWYRFALV